MPLLHARVGLDDPRVRLALTLARANTKVRLAEFGSRKKFSVLRDVQAKGCLYQVLHLSGQGTQLAL